MEHNKENLISHEKNNYLQKLIKQLSLEEDDLPIIQKLSNCPKSIFLEYHNFFTLNKYDLKQKIKNLLESLKDDEVHEKNFLELFLKLAEKYDWKKCWGINCFFEK